MKKLTSVLFLVVVMGILGGCCGGTCGQPTPCNLKGEG